MAEEARGYGKRPLWQWILIYVVIGAIIYGAVYYFFLGKNGGYNTSSSTPTNQSPY
jgi:flagellar basal body-associated protein FliL